MLGFSPPFLVRSVGPQFPREYRTLLFRLGLAGLFSLYLLSVSRLQGQVVSGKVDEEIKSGSTDVAEKVTVLPVNVTLEYRSDNGGYFWGSIELPSLEGGKKYRLNILVVNPTDQAICFSRVVAECSCAKFEAPVDVIHPHDSAMFHMDLDAPPIGGRGRVTTGAKFFDPESQRFVLRLSLAYELNNVFSLPGRRLNVEVPDSTGIVTAKIPITIVPPLTLADLEVEVDKVLSDLSVDLVEEDAIPYVSFTASKRNVPREGLFGQILLRRTGSSQSIGLLVEVKHQEKISISPDSLRFTRVADGSGRYEANAVLRVAVPEPESEVLDKEAEREATQATPRLIPEVAVTVGGQSARVEAKPLGRGAVFRIKVVLDSPVESLEDVEMTWRLRYGREERKIETRAFFSR